MKRIIILITIILIHLTSCAQYFKVFNMDDGLPNNTIKSIVQDKYGFLWLATFNGLSRYDGNSFRNYIHTESEHSLSGNHIEALCDVSKGILIGSSVGIEYLDYQTNRITECHIKGQCIGKMILKFAKVNRSVYAITADGTLIHSVDNNHFFPILAKLLGKVKAIAAIDDNLLAVCSKQEVVLVDISNNHIIQKLSLTNNHSISDDRVLYYSKLTHTLYLGMGIGSPSIALHIEPNRHMKITGQQIPTSLKCVADWGKNVVFGTDGNGLYIVSNGKMRSVVPTNSNISSDAIHSLFVDKESNLWVGTYRGGLNVYSPQYNWFTTFTLANHLMNYPIVSSVYRCGNVVYAGTDGGGLNICNLKTGRIESMTKSNSGLTGNHILTMTADKQHLWMGVYGRGLHSYDFTTHHIKYHPLVHTSEKHIWQLADDGLGNIWITGEGVGIYHKQSGRYTRIPSLKGKMFNCIQFRGDVAWLAADDGIYKINVFNYKIICHYTHLSYSRNIKTLYVDARDKIWFAPDNDGLKYFTEHNRIIHSVGHKQGMECRNIVSITTDNTGQLWVGTENGLFCKQIGTDFFAVFGRKDNMPTPQFCYNSVWQDGRDFIFGTTEGMVMFTPTKMQPTYSKPLICFSSLQLVKDNVSIALQLQNPKKVDLAYNQNFFRIKFSAPHLVGSSKQQIKYRLQGFEDHWEIANNNREASYTNVPPGDYIFEITVIGESDHNTSLAQLPIHIGKPWYDTWLARLLWLFLIAGSIVGVTRLYIHIQKNKALILQKENEQRILKETDETKMNFFAGITHELRTPIFLITAPLEELLEKGEYPISVPYFYLRRMYNNALRLNNLISQILDIRKLDLNQLNPKLQRVELVEHFKHLSRNYQMLCQQKKIHYSFEPTISEILADMDMEKVELVISNLISNAYKYTRQAGKVNLRISADDTTVRFDVIDTGIGINEEDLKHIFDKYYRADNNNTTVGDGFGLAFVRKIVDSLGGTVSVKSQLGQGSDFYFILPRKKSITPAQCILKTNIEELETIEQVKPTVIPTPVATRQILVIDNEQETIDLLIHIFAPLYNVLTANDGKTGLDIVRTKLPDLVICDLMMPVMDGCEFLQQVKGDNKYSHIPVVMFSASDMEEDELKAFNYGADAYLTKPISISYLRTRVSALLAKGMKTESPLSNIKKKYSKEEQVFILQCKEIIDKNLKNPNFGVDFMAQKLCMSHSALYKKIKTVTDKSAVDFINDYRIFIVLKSIENGERNISTMAQNSGFNDVRSFRAAFKARMELSPKQYIKQL